MISTLRSILIISLVITLQVILIEGFSRKIKNSSLLILFDECKAAKATLTMTEEQTFFVQLQYSESGCYKAFNLMSTAINLQTFTFAFQVSLTSLLVTNPWTII
jgi:hypothetical protein